MAKLFIEDLDLNGKRALIRVDFNVPVKNGVVESDKRIVAALPTIKYALEKGASVILMSHLGRPNGQVNQKYTLAPVAKRLEELLGKKVQFVGDCVGADAEGKTAAAKPGDVILLENLRFHIEEEGKIKNADGSKIVASKEDIEEFCNSLSRHGDVFINDAFGTAHRAHASMVGVKLKRASGYLLRKELKFLGEAVENPTRPFVAIIGGAKISGKIDVINSLLPKVDTLIIGGGMAYTFFKAQGYEIGDSLCENDKIDLAKDILSKAGNKIVLPIDILATKKLHFEERRIEGEYIVDFDKIPAGHEGCDIGPKTQEKFANIVKSAKTVVWNGPMGVFEIPETAKGTFAVANALAEATAKGAVTIIGGGDSVSAIEKAGLESKVSHVSTGGGASLEFLEGKELPGVVALSDK
ncbi:MAG: phosphoglycerate kinase [Chitinispirillales bacterium]|nr:phosphoglycerate kinase [Chitinispirillales bacterium]